MDGGSLGFERLAEVGQLVHDVTELRDVRLHSAGRGLFQPHPVQLGADIDEVLGRLGAMELRKLGPGLEGVLDSVDVRQLGGGQGADDLPECLSVLLLPCGASCDAISIRAEGGNIVLMLTIDHSLVRSMRPYTRCFHEP